MRNRKVENLLLSILMACFFIMGGLIASICFINQDIIYRSFVTMPYDRTNGTLIEQDVLDLCNMDGEEYIRCIRDLFISHVAANSSDCIKRGYATYSAMEVLNHGQGCCRDAAEYYSYFLDKKNISNQLVYLPENKPEHVFVVATILKNDSMYSYRVIDFNLIWTVMVK